MTINIEQCRIVVKTYGKSAILMKRTQSYPFSYESYLHLLLSLPCIMPLHLYYVLLDQTFNLFSFLTSRIKQWTPAIEINKSKTLQTGWPRVFSGITQNSMIFFVAWMEAKNQHDSSYSFQVFKFITSDNLVGWEAMSDNASPK